MADGYAPSGLPHPRCAIVNHNFDGQCAQDRDLWERVDIIIWMQKTRRVFLIGWIYRALPDIHYPRRADISVGYQTTLPRSRIPIPITVPRGIHSRIPM